MYKAKFGKRGLCVKLLRTCCEAIMSDMSTISGSTSIRGFDVRYA